MEYVNTVQIRKSKDRHPRKTTNDSKNSRRKEELGRSTANSKGNQSGTGAKNTASGRQKYRNNTKGKIKNLQKNNKKPEPKEKSTIEERFKEMAGYKPQEQEQNTLEPSIELTRQGREGLPPTRKRIGTETRKDSETTMHEQNCLACGSRHHKIKECQQKMNIYVKSLEGTLSKEEIKNKMKNRSVKSIRLHTRGKGVDQAKDAFVCFYSAQEAEMAIKDIQVNHPLWKAELAFSRRYVPRDLWGLGKESKVRNGKGKSVQNRERIDRIDQTAEQERSRLKDEIKMKGTRTEQQRETSVERGGISDDENNGNNSNNTSDRSSCTIIQKQRISINPETLQVLKERLKKHADELIEQIIINVTSDKQ